MASSGYSMAFTVNKKFIFRFGSCSVGSLKLKDCFIDNISKHFRRFCSISLDGLSKKLRQQNDTENSSKNEIENPKILKVAVIGEPNSGKSTFINSLVGEKVFAVTAKPHTTRQGAQAAFSVDNTQIVLLDTPGVVTKSEGRRLKMSRDHLAAPENALQCADLICVLSDSANKKTRDRLHIQVLDALIKHQHIPSILILNKIDKLKHKMDLLGLTAALTQDRAKDQWGYLETGGWGKFSHTFMISAQSGDGMADIKDYFALKAKPGEWMFPPDSSCEFTVEQRIAEVFREKIWILYEHEIPFQIKQVL